MAKTKRRKWTKEQMLDAIKNSYSIAQALARCDLLPNGGNYATFRKFVKETGVDTSHFLGQAHLRGKSHSWAKKRPLSEILVESSSYTSTDSLKRRLLKEGLLNNTCSIKGCPTVKMVEWMSKPLVCHLDHINGVSDDNRLENLRMLCPNCHSQTPTYAGRNIGKTNGKTSQIIKARAIATKYGPPRKRKKTKNSPSKEKPKKAKPVLNCADCLKPVSYKAARCKSCAGFHHRKTKIDWPSTRDLLKRLSTSNYSRLGRELGVTDNAIRKRIKNHPT